MRNLATMFNEIDSILDQCDMIDVKAILSHVNYKLVMLQKAELKRINTESDSMKLAKRKHGLFEMLQDI